MKSPYNLYCYKIITQQVRYILSNLNDTYYANKNFQIKTQRFFLFWFFFLYNNNVIMIHNSQIYTHSTDMTLIKNYFMDDHLIQKQQKKGVPFHFL